MIKTIADFKTQYQLTCEPAAKALEQATTEYEAALKNFLITNFCSEDELQEWKENIWLDANFIFDSARDYVTESMIFEQMISEAECGLYDQLHQFSQPQGSDLS